MKIGIISGSLRKESYSRKIAEAIAGLLPSQIAYEFINIDIPMYNQDFDDANNSPKTWTDFRVKIKECDAFLFVTPEYNRSIPAVIKNALDVGSRPYGENAWGGKKGAVVSISPGAIGGFGANHALRQSVVFLDIQMLQMPEMYLGFVDKSFDDNGKITERTEKFLQKFVDKLVEFID